MTSISEHFAKIGDCFAADLETALAPKCFEGRDQVRLFQAYSPAHNFWFDLAELSDDDWSELKINLENPSLHTIWHNAAFDIRVLQSCGINLGGKYEDTMLISWLLTNGRPVATGFRSNNSLAAVAKREFGFDMDKDLQARNWMEAELNDEDIDYAMDDVVTTYKAWKQMKPRIDECNLQHVYEIELKAILPTIEMESNGLYLDREAIDAQLLDLDDTRVTSHRAFIEELDQELMSAGADPLPRHPGTDEINLNKKTEGSVRLGTKKYAGFNPGSSKQLLARFADIGIEPVDPTGKPSVDKKYLAAYTNRSVIRQYLTWKKSDKHLQMALGLIDAQQDDGRIYARFNAQGTFTGRYSSSGPNLQNIPRGDMRYAFAAPPGRELVDLDYGGMELRALCSPAIADEPNMAEAFISGGDVHRATAALMFDVPPEDITDEERRLSKAVNFGAAYGSSAGGLVNYFQSIGQVISLEEGQEFLNAWLKAYPRIGAWHNLCRELCDGEAIVIMVDGRRRYLSGDSRRHTIMANNIVQGSCASAMKLALYGIYMELPKIDPSAGLVAQIHDEVLIECQEGKGEQILAMAKQQMLQAGKEIFGPKVPLEADGGVGPSWGAAKS